MLLQGRLLGPALRDCDSLGLEWIPSTCLVSFCYLEHSDKFLIPHDNKLKLKIVAKWYRKQDAHHNWPYFLSCTKGLYGNNSALLPPSSTHTHLQIGSKMRISLFSVFNSSLLFRLGPCVYNCKRIVDNTWSYIIEQIHFKSSKKGAIQKDLWWN